MFSNPSTFVALFLFVFIFSVLFVNSVFNSFEEFSSVLFGISIFSNNSVLLFSEELSLEESCSKEVLFANPNCPLSLSPHVYTSPFSVKPNHSPILQYDPQSYPLIPLLSLPISFFE